MCSALPRRAFLMLAAGAFAAPRVARAQSDADPAITSNRPALRVLLGAGETSAASPGTFAFEGRLYRGGFVRLDDGQIVNVVDVEAYLYSVVPAEMSPRWPAAALEAQAICSRTYVLQRSDPRRAYDLVPSEIDQVYKGIEGEAPGATAAVDASAGRVLTYASGFAQIAYSSCCGGHTEASADAWNGVGFPYLQGVVCPWCSASPYFRWSAALDLQAIDTRYSASLAPFGNLEDLRVSQRDQSGRARAFELIAEHGSLVVKGSAFRLAVGSRVLRSLLVLDLAPPTAGTVVVDGGGLGHGVGLCQWGARGMALENHPAEEILALYFPGTQIGNLNNLR